MRVRRWFGLDHDELSLVNAFQPAEFSCEMLQDSGRATQGDQLHAQVVTQMDVHRRDDVFPVGMLDVDHLVSQFGPVVIVDQCEACRHLGRSCLPRSGGELFAEQLADRFAPGSKLASRAEPVELL